MADAVSFYTNFFLLFGFSECQRAHAIPFSSPFHRRYFDSETTFAGWATSLSAGEPDWTYEFSFFKVVIDLTDAGHGKYFLFSFFLRVGGWGEEFFQLF